MDKEKVLQLSRSENAGARDERERAALGNASRHGMLVGALLCALLMLADEPVFHAPALGEMAWLMFFATQGSSGASLYRSLRERKYLLIALFELALALLCAARLVLAYGR